MKSTSSIIFSAATLLLSSMNVDASEFYLTSLPCGDSAMQTCDQTIGHTVDVYDEASTGNTNTFATDFVANDRTWNSDLCMMNSLSDEYTNGEMLGDPDCVWTVDDGFPEESVDTGEDGEEDGDEETAGEDGEEDGDEETAGEDGEEDGDEETAGEDGEEDGDEETAGEDGEEDGGEDPAETPEEEPATTPNCRRL